MMVAMVVVVVVVGVVFLPVVVSPGVGCSMALVHGPTPSVQVLVTILILMEALMMTGHMCSTRT